MDILITMVNGEKITGTVREKSLDTFIAIQAINKYVLIGTCALRTENIASVTEIK